MNPIPTVPVNLSGEEPGILAGRYVITEHDIQVEANSYSQKFSEPHLRMGFFNSYLLQTCQLLIINN
jgi:hypothetical protein